MLRQRSFVLVAAATATLPLMAGCPTVATDPPPGQPCDGVVCDDGNSCTTDSCLTLTGACTNTQKVCGGNSVCDPDPLCSRTWSWLLACEAGELCRSLPAPTHARHPRHRPLGSGDPPLEGARTRGRHLVRLWHFGPDQPPASTARARTAGWPREVALPGLPQIRTCAIGASGSLGHGLAYPEQLPVKVP